MIEIKNAEREELAKCFCGCNDKRLRVRCIVFRKRHSMMFASRVAHYQVRCSACGREDPWCEDIDEAICTWNEIHKKKLLRCKAFVVRIIKRVFRLI